jgi:hypothetical protein
MFVTNVQILLKEKTKWTVNLHPRGDYIDSGKKKKERDKGINRKRKSKHKTGARRGEIEK